MGHIKTIKMENRAGEVSIRTEIEGSLTREDVKLLAIIASAGPREYRDWRETQPETDESEPEKVEDTHDPRVAELEAELATSNGYRSGISADLRQVEEQSSGLSRELNSVAALIDESPARGVLFGPGIDDGVAQVVHRRLERDKARVAALEGLVDAARGAAGLLCDRFGIEHGPNSQAHKMIKQAMGRVVEVSDIYGRMSFELGNLRGALVRLGFADAPAVDPTQPADKYCAQLGHHIDLAKRQGVTLTQPTNTEGLEMTRDQRMAQLKALFQSSQRAILDMAILDGYVKEGMEPKQAMAEAMRWAADHSVIETGERKESESERSWRRAQQKADAESAEDGPGPSRAYTAETLNAAMGAAKPPDVESPKRRDQKGSDAKKLADRMERDGGDADDDRAS